jgi:hypothetical protein
VAHKNVSQSQAPWRSWLARRPVTAEVAGSSPVGVAEVSPPQWAGSSVGTSVRLKSGRSAVRPRPCPPLPGLTWAAPRLTQAGRLSSGWHPVSGQRPDVRRSRLADHHRDLSLAPRLIGAPTRIVLLHPWPQGLPLCSRCRPRLQTPDLRPDLDRAVRIGFEVEIPLRMLRQAPLGCKEYDALCVGHEQQWRHSRNPGFAACVSQQANGEPQSRGDGHRGPQLASSTPIKAHVGPRQLLHRRVEGVGFQKLGALSQTAHWSCLSGGQRVPVGSVFTDNTTRPRHRRDRVVSVVFVGCP